MLPPAVAEQQAKLGDSTEDSKAQRLKRQQARFRDRGGAFVPSNSNPLLDILLARTVSGESPSKAHPKNFSAKRLSPSKARQTSAVTVSDENRAVAACSKSKPPASRKRNRKAAELEVDLTIEPAPKRRGRPAKGKNKAPDADCDTEQQLPRPKSGSTSKGKGKQRDVSTFPSADAKPKPRAKTKSNSVKAVVEVPASDDNRTLVEVPHKSKSNSDKKIRHGDDGAVDDGAPIVRKRVLPPTDDSRTADRRTAPRVEAGKIPTMGSSQKRAEDKETMVHDERRPKPNTKRHVVPRGGGDGDDVVSPVVKKGKVANAAPRSKVPIEPQLVLHITKETESQGNPKVTGNGKRRRRVEPAEDEERHLDRTYKAKKREKEDDYDDRPRKTIRFSDTGPPHSSSKKLKENQSNREQKSAAKSRVKAKPDGPPLDSVTVLPSRVKRSKGPPREVLERIKASAARRLQCADSEPDELDCLS